MGGLGGSGGAGVKAGGGIEGGAESGAQVGAGVVTPILQVVPKLSFSKADIAAYLDSPPAGMCHSAIGTWPRYPTLPPGIDSRLWQQAQADNPSPSTLLPVPMVGFR